VKEIKGSIHKVLSMYLGGIGWANCFRTHNELNMCPLGKYPLAPSVNSFSPSAPSQSYGSALSGPSNPLLHSTPSTTRRSGRISGPVTPAPRFSTLSSRPTPALSPRQLPPSYLPPVAETAALTAPSRTTSYLPDIAGFTPPDPPQPLPPVAPIYRQLSPPPQTPKPSPPPTPPIMSATQQPTMAQLVQAMNDMQAEIDRLKNQPPAPTAAPHTQTFTPGVNPVTTACARAINPNHPNVLYEDNPPAAGSVNIKGTKPPPGFTGDK
jgi:hypothetical protein